MLNRAENGESNMEFDLPPEYTFSDPHSSPSPESSIQRSSNMETELKRIVIAVMGVTGAGKSRFVQRATGADVEIGHSQASCTHEVAGFDLIMPPYHVHLVDTPGFDDSFKNDAEILDGIAEFLRQVHDQRGKLSGILYLHQITDARMRGSALKNLTMFQKLMGTRALTNCVLVTTKWGNVDKAVGHAREKELLQDARFGWKNMVANHAQVARFEDTSESAIRIIQSVAGLRECVPKLTEELCYDKKKLKDTAAGRVVIDTLKEQLADKQAEIELTKQQQAQALREKDTEYAKQMQDQRAVLEAEMERVREGQALMEQRVEEMRRASEARALEIRAAEKERRKHSTKRTIGRWAGGILGTGLIVVTGGLAAPLVLGAAAVAEGVYHEEKVDDRNKLDRLHAAA